MKSYHSVVVIGGGPAGSAAAYTLAKHGVDVCIIDKAIFPRNKLCGGLLTLRSKKVFSEIFDGSWDAAYENKANGVRFCYNNITLNCVENYSELFFTSRINYDSYLLKMAELKGSALYLGHGVVSVSLRDKICRLSSGAEITYDYLIAADGVSSLVAKTIYGQAYDKNKIAFALEIEVAKTNVKKIVTIPEIHFGVVSWGYGWVFPKKDTLTVGVGGIHSKNPEMRDRFSGFLRNLFGEIPDEKIKGHYIPFGDYKKTPGIDDVLLVGDAAGLVEPITGEGIAFAMQSGYFAGLSIIESVRSCNKKRAINVYKEKYREIARALDHANLLRYLIFPKVSESLFVKLLPKTRLIPLKHLDLMAGSVTYEEYMRFLVTRGLAGLVRRVLFR